MKSGPMLLEINKFFSLFLNTTGHSTTFSRIQFAYQELIEFASQFFHKHTYFFSRELRKS
jgi:hypothetical protein